MNFSKIILFLAAPFIYNLPLFFSGLLALFLFFPKIADFLKKRIKKRRFRKIALALIILLGLYFRLCLAFYFGGNSDIRSWDKISQWIIEGQPIYNATRLFGYFPPWAVFLGLIKKISLALPQFSVQPNFYFLLRGFLSLIDLLIFFLLLALAKGRGSSILKTGVSFWLNPAIIIITAYHGQFEGLAVLFLLLGIYLYKKQASPFLSWLTISFSGFTKHMFLNQFLIWLNHVYKKNKIKLILFLALSGFLGVIMLLPFWQAGWKTIKDNIFCSYSTKDYGISFVLSKLNLWSFRKTYRSLFTYLFFGIPFFLKKKNLSQSCLIGSLFFITFTPGMSDQYFVIPIALGALSQSPLFYLYCLFTSLYLLGSPAQFDLALFKLFSKNIIFLISAVWLFKEVFSRNDTQG